MELAIWATAVELVQVFDNWPQQTVYSRFTAGGLLAIEDFTFFKKQFKHQDSVGYMQLDYYADESHPDMAYNYSMMTGLNQISTFNTIIPNTQYTLHSYD